MSATRMRANDLARPFHAVRQRAAPRGAAALCRAYQERMPPNAFFCSVTAALIIGIPLPLNMEQPTSVHVAVPAPGRGARGRNVVGHKLLVEPEDIRIWRGFRITSPERTWCDLAPLLTLPELVAAGDFLIHWRLPYTTATRLAEKTAAFAGRRGTPLLREAITLVHDRSESPRESRLRVILIRAGIEGFEVNFPINLPGARIRYRADFAISSLKVIIEYQGDHHRDPKQWREDMTRISRLEAHGWYVIQVNANDLADPRELVARIRLVIEQRSA